jgi:hypothetical protein
MTKPQKTDESLSVYVAFLTTPTKIGKTIRFVSRNKYSHVALSFEEDLSTMYSFARYCVNAPLIAGFVKESILRYYYNDNPSVPVKICKIPLPPEKYSRVRDYIHSMEENSEQYIYNYLALAAAPLKLKILIEKSFTCLEFVYSVLYNCGIETSLDISSYYTIVDLERVLEKHVAFEGFLEPPTEQISWGSDLFCCKKSTYRVLTGSIRCCGSLLRRAFRN